MNRHGLAAMPTFQELQRWNASPLPDLPELNVTILRNIVLDPVVPYLRFLAYREGLNATCKFGEYDNVVQEALGGAPELLNESTDCVLVFLRIETLAPSLASGFAGLSGEQIEAEETTATATITDILAGIRRQTPAMILWHTFETPLHPAFGALDGQKRGDGQTASIRRLNDALSDALQNAVNAFSVDLDRCRARVGGDDFYDRRYWHAARAPYTLRALREMALEDIKYIRAQEGRARKCLVLDCDGVLWGGTIGEDGLAGIRLGTSYPGSGFHEFQQEILNLYHRGVLIALCSKNNADDVWDVFERHPDMVLKRHHVAAARINWMDKATNLVEIASELNIGVDSLVMIDDNDFEVDLIRQFLPEVSVIGLPAGKASDYGTILASCGLFDTLTLSAEDRARGAAYQAEAGRRELQREAGDMQAFLQSLDMALEIRFADDFARPRVAQLTQKTNQFNLTTRRYSEEDIRRFQDSENADVIYLRYRDRFGDAGIVGVCILVYDQATAVVDSFMLSCRILGRSVEDAFLSGCLVRARQRGALHAVGEYRPTQKNVQVKEFYPTHGFSPARENSEGDHYRFDLEHARHLVPDLFRIDSDITSDRTGPETQTLGIQEETSA